MLFVPKDLSTALAREPPAQTYFAETPPSYRRNLLRWIDQAKRAETRARRVAAIVEACAALRRIPQM